MAISQTMSNPNDWLFQPYQNDFSHSHINQSIQTPTDSVAAARAVGSSHLSPEQGRVAKPTRRRSRASRRTPTTLLNTDTANFRAMVQHFTGGPAAAASSVSFAARPPPPPPNRGGAAVSYVDGGNFHVQYPNQLQHQHMFVMENVHGGGGGAPPPHAAVGSGNRISYDNFMV